MTWYNDVTVDGRISSSYWWIVEVGRGYSSDKWNGLLVGARNKSMHGTIL
jgi:hypothetical protein